MPELAAENAGLRSEVTHLQAPVKMLNAEICQMFTLVDEFREVLTKMNDVN